MRLRALVAAVTATTTTVQHRAVVRARMSGGGGGGGGALVIENNHEATQKNEEASMMMLKKTQEEKQMLRKQIRTVLKSLPADYLDAQSCLACAKLVASPEWRDAPGVACFCSMTKEFQTKTLLEAAFNDNKRVFLPRVEHIDDRRMRLLEASSLADVAEWPRSKWGIPEPPKVEGDGRADALDVGPDGLSLIIVPGVAFDSRGGRLGQGAGFYDAWLDEVRAARAERGEPMPRLVGVGLDEQLLLSSSSSSSSSSSPQQQQRGDVVVVGEGTTPPLTVPTAPHDIHLDRVITPSHSFETRAFTAPVGET